MQINVPSVLIGFFYPAICRRCREHLGNIIVSEKKLREPLVLDARPLGTEEPAPTADKEELPVILFLFYVLIRRYCPYFHAIL